MPEISIIIVSYNVKAYLKACLESLYQKIKDVTFEVIVVDNYSSDGSVEMVRELFPEAILIALKKNVGFARANNYGILKSRGDDLLLLNPDTAMVTSGLGILLTFMHTHPTIGVVGCRMVNTDGSLQPSCYHFPSLREIAALYIPIGNTYSPFQDIDYDEAVEVEYVRGSFMVIRGAYLKTETNWPAGSAVFYVWGGGRSVLSNGQAWL